MTISKFGGSVFKAVKDAASTVADAVTPSASPPANTPAPAPAAGVSAPPPPPPSAETVDGSRKAATAQAGLAQQAWLAKAGAVGTPSAPPALPAGTYDAGKTTPEQIAALKASKDPQDQHLAATIERCRTNYADQIGKGARVLVNKGAGNGGEPVATLIPPGFDYNKPARVDTHYHGFSGTVADPLGHGSGTTARMAELQKKDPQTVFVLPECKNAPAKGGSYHTDWSNVKSQAATTDDALSAAGIKNVGASIVSAHSGGGAALTYAMAAHKDGSGIKADRLELQDCLYGSQSAVHDWSQTANGKAVKDVVYLHGTNDANNDATFKKDFPGKYTRINVAQPKPGEVPDIVDDSGKSIGKKKYNADAHNRTVGEFMDSVPGPL